MIAGIYWIAELEYGLRQIVPSLYEVLVVCLGALRLINTLNEGRTRVLS
jgi:hypothetical protein